MPVKSQRPRGSIFFHSSRLDHLCQNCHGAMLNERVAIGLIREPVERARIRRMAHRFYFSETCSNCHRPEMTPETPPASHDDSQWLQNHKKVAPDFNCRICHSKNFCQECHDDTY